MMTILALATAATLAGQGLRAPPPCPGRNTREVNRCFEQRLERAVDDLGRYAAAARRRLKQEAAEAPSGSGGGGDPTRGFDAAEKAWSAYREAECAAVYEHWAGGTIRTAKEINCRIRLTRLHTHTVWQEWLTYADNTPPILPEPPVSPD